MSRRMDCGRLVGGYAGVRSSRYRLTTRGAPRFVEGQWSFEFYFQDCLPSDLFTRTTVNVRVHSHLPRIFDGLQYVQPTARDCTFLPRVKSSTENSGFSMAVHHVATKVHCDTCENSLGAPVTVLTDSPPASWSGCGLSVQVGIAY